MLRKKQKQLSNRNLVVTASQALIIQTINCSSGIVFLEIDLERHERVLRYWHGSIKSNEHKTRRRRRRRRRKTLCSEVVIWVNQANIIVTLPHDFNTVNNPFFALSREMGEFHQDNKRSKWPERKRGRFFVSLEDG